MAKWRMADVMDKRQGLREVNIQIEGFGNGARDLRDFEGMRQTIAKVIGVTSSEDLRLCFQPAKGSRMNNAVAIACIFATIWVRWFGKAAATGVGPLHGPGGKRGVAFDGCSSGLMSV
jgi:hypothetical protein